MKIHRFSSLFKIRNDIIDILNDCIEWTLFAPSLLAYLTVKDFIKSVEENYNISIATIHDDGEELLKVRPYQLLK